MPQTSIQIASDSEFYALVHELVEAEKLFAQHGQSAAEQRAANRKAFACQQLLAPFDGHRLPSQSEFRPMVCQDLSAGGFAFVAPQRVEFDQLVVALGQVPFKFFTARVQNQSRVRLKGGLGFRVGCRFTGRIVAS
jgi:hypothetical protein